MSHYFQDEKKIEEYLKDNEEDVDSTMSFILQMMDLSEASDGKGTDFFISLKPFSITSYSHYMMFILQVIHIELGYSKTFKR